MVASGHRMVADGWAMFEEAIEGAGEGDLPQLLRHLRGVTTPTPPPPPPQPQQESVPPSDSQPTPLLAKKIKTENVGDKPVIVMVGGLVHGPAPNVILLGGQKMVVTPTYGRSTQEKPLCVPSAVFPHTIWIHCRGMKRNTIDLILLYCK